MRSIEVTKQTLAHSNPITSIVRHPCLQNKTQILSIGHDGYLRIWNTANLNLVREISLPSKILMCMIHYRDGIFIGTGKGQLLFLNCQFELIFKIKIHQDCLSGIIQKQQQLITVGYDGYINFLNKQTMEIEKSINIQVPIYQCVEFENILYTAGNPSFKIDLSNYKIKQISRYDYFKQFKGKLYACSDDKGLTCLSQNSNSYIPCHFLLPFSRNLLAFSDESIGLINHEEHVEWKCKKIQEIKPGNTIKAGVVLQTGIFIGGDQGILQRVSCAQYSSFYHQHKE